MIKKVRAVVKAVLAFLTKLLDPFTECALYAALTIFSTMRYVTVALWIT